MLKSFRQQLICHLWQNHKSSSSQLKKIEMCLKQKGIPNLVLDHFAIIDLPGPNTGIPYLKELFSTIGYIEQGSDYLPEKQNDFLWMTEADSVNLPALHVLPQVVVADFRMDELPLEVKKIIEKYASASPPLPQSEIKTLADRVSAGDTQAAASLSSILTHYLTGRDWPLPTTKEFSIVHEFNELLGWVLIFGRKPNHFTLSIHLLDHFASLSDFLCFISEEVKLELNQEGGIVKGGKKTGIAQASTKGTSTRVTLQEGQIELPLGFVEFVWRYIPHPESINKQKPLLFRDYFTGFVAQHADHIIESLYT